MGQQHVRSPRRTAEAIASLDGPSVPPRSDREAVGDADDRVTTPNSGPRSEDEQLRSTRFFDGSEGHTRTGFENVALSQAALSGASSFLEDANVRRQLDKTERALAAAEKPSRVRYKKKLPQEKFIDSHAGRHRRKSERWSPGQCLPSG